MWLLNVAHMTLGTYPEGVPSRFVVAKKALESEYDIGKFDEIAPYAGLYAVNTAGGSIIEDFDNDGLLDVMTSDMGSVQVNYLLPQQGGRHICGLHGEGRTVGATWRAEHHADGLQQRRVDGCADNARRVDEDAWTDANVSAAE